MATIVTCDSFWTELFKANKDHVYKLALFTRSGTGQLGKGTAGYATTINGCAEVTGTNYTAGGITLSPGTGGTPEGTGASVRVDAGAHKVGYDWANGVFTNVTISGIKAAGFYALIYDDTVAGKPAVAVGEFTGAEPEFTNDPTAANFTVTLPSSGTMVAFVTA
jgi:hypothetical protein